MTPLPFVVAGATGRVGSAVAGELLRQRQPVVVVVRDPRQSAEWERRGALATVGSLADEAFLSHTLDAAAGFFVLLPENVAPDDFHGARRRMADAIAGAVRRSGVPHVAMLSAVAASLPSGNGPAGDLHYLEERLRASGKVISILRSSFFQENVASALMPAQQHGVYPSFVGPPDAQLSMIATRDVGRFAAEALMQPPPSTEVVDLIGPTYSVRAVADRLGAALGKTLQVLEIPADRQSATLREAGIPPQIAEAVAEMFAALRAGKFVREGTRRREATTGIEEVIARLAASEPSLSARRE